ncbi:DnaA regulatory inactivator Hda [Pseudoxanthomonas broegbernensis]|uniref:DnaA regulatory inactivator Hda n=1 Tax=Pseudoxanthomonas broegbernensis TaxID=83619 RepID=A0A7V8GKA1_9GAMM|nr:DnaA regulatory inactivator Hda [Pseudoxanthomonas broegbernensis]KAF1684859.1 DnaA regulatory inactivator Hda [Pseudoxanthomonas broegbernensis]MBB6065265.1 DnaA family protein [Pseudoxanthomonas broegbernensis]
MSARPPAPPARAGGTPQLPLALRYPPDQRLDSYIGAPAGAVEQLRALARRPGADWLYLEGTAGSGKTHLGLAACADAEQAGRRAVYLPLRAVAGRLRDALEAMEADLVALDGLEAAAGRRDDEVALFDFHNRARAAGMGVLYLAAAAPPALPLVLPDLRSRLGQCTRIALRPLDDDARRQVLHDRARRRGLVLETAAVDWLLTRTGRDLVQLLALLDRIDRESLAAQRRVTVPFLRGMLGNGREGAG